eukprot:gene22597-3023_t
MAVTSVHGGVLAAAAVLLVRTSSVHAQCVSNVDCLLLGSCEQGVCNCRQGFTGHECGQLDLAPAPPHLGYRNLTASTWGGLPVKVQGKWHMYVSMMVGDCPLGTFNNNSEVVHLVSSSPTDWKGPYRYADTVVGPFAHNAAPRVLADGSVAVWYIGYDGVVNTIACPKGVPPPNDVWPDWSGKQMAVARSPPGAPSGPWNVTWLFKKAKLPQDWWHWDCSSTNPSALVAADGTVQMLERLGFATAPSVDGPYAHASVALNLGNASVEDPFYWRSADGSHHLIAHSGVVCHEYTGGSNWCGVIASSADGANWRLATTAAYGPNVTLTNGTTLKLFARQRPQLLFDPTPAGAGVGGSKGQGEPTLLALVNGAELEEGTRSLMQGSSFTLIQPVD